VEVRARPRVWSVTHVVAALALFAGVVTLTYPTAATWFSDLAHRSEISGYVEEIRSASDGDLEARRASAHAYNDELPSGPLRDPYLLKADGDSQDLSEGWDEYLSQLSTSPDRPLARLRIPSLDIDLPIFHGTSGTVLERGVGHLFGTALPVGGHGTHAVLAGHSGLPGSTLFTHLDRLELGDVFLLDVAGETLTYVVDRIEVVEPDDTEGLRPIVDEDVVTLLTCTPTGVNTHRLLVRGSRVEAAEGEERAREVSGEGRSVDTPWWIAAVVGGVVMSLAVAWPRRSRREDASDHSGHDEQ
jgi:sortase A